MGGASVRSVVLFSLVAFFCSAVEAQDPERRPREPDPKEQLQRLHDPQSRGVKGQGEYERELAEVAKRFGLDREPPTLPLEERDANDIETPPSLENLPLRRKLRERYDDERIESILEDLEANLSSRYRLLDVSGNVLFWGDETDGLALKLRDVLSDGARHSLYVEMKGYSEPRTDALLSTLRIKLHPIDPTDTISVLPHFAENPSVRDELFTRRVRFEHISEPESIASGKDAGGFLAIAEFTVRIGNNVRNVAIWISSATKEFIAEFHELVLRQFPTYAFDEQQSLSELIHGARAELMANHGLTDQQFHTSIKSQFGKIDISLLGSKVLLAWS